MAEAEGVETYRPGSARPIAVATWATCGAMAAGQLLGGAFDSIGAYAVLSGLAFVCAVAWAALWRPRIELAPHGVVLRNPARTVLVTWPAVTGVDGRYGLRIETADAAWSAWAAAPPTGRGRRSGAQSEAASLVDAAWQRVDAAGHLRAGAVEGAGATVTWQPHTLLVTVGLLLLTVVLGVLA